MLAVAAAVGELRRNGELEVEVVMLVEGEEETGSAGFQEAVRKNRVSLLAPGAWPLRSRWKQAT